MIEAGKSILTINAGSSSVKFALFSSGVPPERILHGAIERIGSTPRFHAGDTEQNWSGTVGFHDLIARLFDWLETAIACPLEAVGHRIVHGGDDFIAPVRLDDTVLGRLAALTPLAPLHQLHNLEPVRMIARHRPGLSQFGCFDTAFHHTVPVLHRTLPIPGKLGLRRYGFHGLSYEFIARRLLGTGAAGSRIVVAHLGNGASACALRNGVSIDTTMGATALDGMMMGTRSGAVDPGALLYLMTERGYDAKSLASLLYDDSGLKGVSGISGDMRSLHESSASGARLAIDLFVLRAAQEIARMAVSLGGIDSLVFTGGIGEN
ncbi:MAG TPA: acetate kinase, partial [Acidiphilium sp.]